ncbi:TerB family tellurite resistance protein [Abyssalbus ytuae]|uniref:TerB family tellurite resistance protein n=1 Tax=Abyssalbus ytuae TaxID=2926907 RepID=A0A9E6ZXM3_9FLAO|nr:TerB family tellurite resistance protein [Abyssalbus ytuae]UOB17047.1 TerB family tellurite resistance protein [Abyssalbus ytuae]
MDKKQEVLSLLSEMIALVKADNNVSQKEYNFIYAIALQFEIEKEELDALFEKSTDYYPPKNEADRILQFHRLVLLMNVDEKQHPEEMNKIREFGIRMGLSPFAIDRVLTVMNNFEDKIVPPSVLIDIFKTYYN